MFVTSCVSPVSVVTVYMVHAVEEEEPKIWTMETGSFSSLSLSLFCGTRGHHGA